VPSAEGKEVPGTRNFSHGLGVGDVNGDKRQDVICTGGWWEQPEKPDGKTPWKFHPAKLGDTVADMYAYDVTGDGKADVIASSAHKFGIWYFEQRAAKKGTSPAFIQRDLFPKLVSETHAMCLADIDGDGKKDFVTGKRWWSHGRAEPGADWPAMIYWFQAKKAKDGVISFTPRIIDEDSGIGTQFVVTDVNGDKLLDVVTSNKKGTYLFEQVRAKK
jgi:FG-GAP-like repeat